MAPSKMEKKEREKKKDQVVELNRKSEISRIRKRRKKEKGRIKKILEKRKRGLVFISVMSKSFHFSNHVQILRIILLHLFNIAHVPIYAYLFSYFR